MRRGIIGIRVVHIWGWGGGGGGGGVEGGWIPVTREKGEG